MKYRLLLLRFFHSVENFLRNKFHKYPYQNRYHDDIISESEKEDKIWQSIHRHEDVAENSEREQELGEKGCFWMEKYLLRCFKFS